MEKNNKESLALFAAEIEDLKERLASIAKEEAEAAEKARVEAEKRKAAEEAMAAANKKAGEAVDAYNKAIEAARRNIEARRSLGEEITENEERQIMLEARKSAYLNMISQAQGTISGNLERERKAREEIARLAAEIAAYDQSAEGLADKYSKKGGERAEEPSWEEQKQSLLEARAAIKELQDSSVDDLSLTTEQKIALEKKYAAAVEEINRELAEGERQSNEERFAAFTATFEQIGSYVQQTAQLIQNAMAFQLEAVQTEKESELAAVENAYRKGEISEEEYNEKKEQIEKEAAQKEYRIKMWEWAANIAQATANVAMAAVGAAAQTQGNAAARIIAMSLIGAAAGVQLASLIASKPVPPSFATGGFIGGMNGARMGPDDTYIHAKTGELVANAAQQRNLWEAMNGNFKGGQSAGGGMTVVINNSASNVVTAQPKISERQMEIFIDARVKEGLESGKYNSALTKANQSMDGDFYGV